MRMKWTTIWAIDVTELMVLIFFQISQLLGHDDYEGDLDVSVG